MISRGKQPTLDKMKNATATIQRFSPGLIWIPALLVAMVYLPALRDLVVNWYQDGNYSHGFLIPIVSLYMLWSIRSELATLPKKSSRGGLILLIAGMVLFILGNAAAEYFTVRFSFVLVLYSLVWYFSGRVVARRVWFPFFFLLFMIPIPYVLYYAVAFPMQLAATKITVKVLAAVGMEVVRQGNIIHLAGGYSLEVAEACSGIRSLTALLALGALYAYITQKKLTAQLLLFVFTIPVSVFANVVRVFTTTLLVSAVGLEITREPLHTIMGLSVFVVSFVCLAIAGGILRKVFR